MWEAMVRVDMARRLTAHRVLSPILCLLALVGWGAFAYAAGSSASTQRDLRAELADMKARQEQLLAERKHVQEAVGNLAQVQATLASARREPRREHGTRARQREQATAQITTARHELASATKRLEGKQAKASETQRTRLAERVGKADRSDTPTKSKT